MVPEVEKWLADMRDHDPAAADGIDEAVAALRAGGTSMGPPLVVPVDSSFVVPVESPSRPGAAASIQRGRSGPRRGQRGRSGPRRGQRGRSAAGAARWLLAKTALPGLDAAYERQREMLTPMRRTAADVATSRKRLELQIGQLEREVAEQGGTAPDAAQGRLADLRRRYAALRAEEERVMVASQRLQATIEDFRTRMEAAKSAYLAAQEAVETTWAEVAPDHAVSAGPAHGAFWLSELRPAAPESAGTRILFTVEPSGTAVLLAAGTESDRLHAWYAEAIARSRLRYQRTRKR